MPEDDSSPTGSLAPSTNIDIDQTIASNPNVTSSATVGLIADIHFDQDDEAALEESIVSASKEFAAADVDFVMLMGDIITEGDGADGDTETLINIRTLLENHVDAPLLAIPGNHDVMNLEAIDILRITRTTHQDIDQYDLGLGDVGYTFEMTPDITGIALDSSAPAYPDGRGYIPEEQLNWLEEKLDDADNAVIFVHHPVHYHDLDEKSWFSEHPEVAFTQNKFEVTEILDDYQDTVLTVFNGHTHLYDITAYHDIPHITVPSMNFASPAHESPNGRYAIASISASRTHVHLTSALYDHNDDSTPLRTRADVSITQQPSAETTVALGGTFDPVHDGHRQLFRRGFELGDLVVGLTTDDLAPKTRHEERFILPFEERKNSLDAVLSQLSYEYERDYRIEALDDPTGVVESDPSVTHLLVSTETLGRALDINDVRRENGIEPLTIEIIDPIQASDGDVLSSTRICKGEIDPHGNLTPNAQGRQPIE